MLDSVNYSTWELYTLLDNQRVNCIRQKRILRPQDTSNRARTRVRKTLNSSFGNRSNDLEIAKSYWLIKKTRFIRFYVRGIRRK